MIKRVLTDFPPLNNYLRLSADAHRTSLLLHGIIVFIGAFGKVDHSLRLLPIIYGNGLIKRKGNGVHKEISMQLKQLDGCSDHYLKDSIFGMTRLLIRHFTH